MPVGPAEDQRRISGRSSASQYAASEENSAPHSLQCVARPSREATTSAYVAAASALSAFAFAAFPAFPFFGEDAFALPARFAAQ